MLTLNLVADCDNQRENKIYYIYNRFAGLMYHVAFEVIQNKDLAEDVVQDTYIRILKDIDKIRIDNDAELSQFIRLITYSQAVDFLRKWDRRGITQEELMEEQSSDSDVKSLEEIVITHETVDKVVSALTNMHSMYRVPLTLQYKGYSMNEIARALGLSVAAVKTRIHRARQILLTIAKEE